MAVKGVRQMISGAELKSHLLQAGDAMIVIGHSGDLPSFTETFVKTKELTYRGVRTHAGPAG